MLKGFWITPQKKIIICSGVHEDYLRSFECDNLEECLKKGYTRVRQYRDRWSIQTFELEKKKEILRLVKKEVENTWPFDKFAWVYIHDFSKNEVKIWVSSRIR